MKTNVVHSCRRGFCRHYRLLALVAALGLAADALAATVSASRGRITLPTYPWAAVKHPYFRGTDKVNIYPYPMLDFLSREKTNRTYRTVILENEYLRITFLPELGGKIHEVTDKTTGQPMFYVNHVIKPGLIGQCGAWTSGGVEWNTGPQGHTVSAMQPVDVDILPPQKDGSRSVVIGETERIYGTKWTVVVTLRPGRRFIEEHIRIENPTEYVRPYYFWNCTAVPNMPGFRFIYPMTLGTDHGAEKFFHWPIHEGKDLSRGTNYQDASSIFAWHCDQDFFGSYDDLADRGVVSCANHHQVPGKKAWTWGQGGFGKMHQMDLTDDDGPYNEVQTGPLLTQGEVGRLDPGEVLEWPEWWYPVHGLGGFTFANTNLAANVETNAGALRFRLLGTGTWRRAKFIVQQDQWRAERIFSLTPRTPADLSVSVPKLESSVTIRVCTSDDRPLAAWSHPVPLPARTPPPKKAPPQTASELVRAGWQDFLLARYPEAEKRFRSALEKDATCPEALVGLANLELDRAPQKAAEFARTALATHPDFGPAHFVLAVAECRLAQETAAVATAAEHAANALEAAWKATLDPATAHAARALIERLSLRPESAPARPLPQSDEGDWPFAYASLPKLRSAVETNPTNGLARLRLGHLLFHLGRHDEGRAQWQRAAELGAEPVVAWRALGMAAKTLDNDLKSARQWLEKANRADPQDAIVARDLARVLFELAGQTDDRGQQQALWRQARDTLRAAFAAGKGRSDFVALLGRAHNRLGEFAETARLLDQVRVTVWEGAREVHDLFEDAHLALGEAHLQAGRAAEALAEFNRALEYPENLATGRLENTREAHIHYLRGNALAALGRTIEAIQAWRQAAEEPASKDEKKEKARRQAREALERAQTGGRGS